MYTNSKPSTKTLFKEIIMLFTNINNQVISMQLSWKLPKLLKSKFVILLSGNSEVQMKFNYIH